MVLWEGNVLLIEFSQSVHGEFQALPEASAC